MLYYKVPNYHAFTHPSLHKKHNGKLHNLKMTKKKPQTKLTELKEDCETQPPKSKPKRTKNLRTWRICHAVLMTVIFTYALVMYLLYFIRSSAITITISLLFNIFCGYVFSAGGIFDDVPGLFRYRVAAFVCQFAILLYTVTMHLRHALFE